MFARHCGPSSRALSYYLDELRLLAARCRSTTGWSAFRMRRGAQARSPAACQPAGRAIPAGDHRDLCSVGGDGTGARSSRSPATCRRRRTALWCQRRVACRSCDPDGSLVANGSGILAKGRLRNLRRAVDVFGFISPRRFAPNSDVHERSVGEMLGLGNPPDYTGLAERAHRLLLAELGTARPLASPFSPTRRDRERIGDPQRDRRGASPPGESGGALCDFHTTASPTFSKPRCC